MLYFKISRNAYYTVRNGLNSVITNIHSFELHIVDGYIQGRFKRNLHRSWITAREFIRCL